VNWFAQGITNVKGVIAKLSDNELDNIIEDIKKIINSLGLLILGRAILH
jgi:hypothetical protein